MSSKHTLLTRSVLAALISGSLVACGGSSSSSNDDMGDDGGGGGSTPPPPSSFLVSTEFNTGGSLSPTEQDVEEGDTAEFTVTIDDGYHLETISGCDGALDAEIYTTGAITADCTVTAEFDADVSLSGKQVSFGSNPSLNEETSVAIETDEDVTGLSWSLLNTETDEQVAIAVADDDKSATFTVTDAGNYRLRIASPDNDTAIVSEFEISPELPFNSGKVDANDPDASEDEVIGVVTNQQWIKAHSNLSQQQLESLVANYDQLTAIGFDSIQGLLVEFDETSTLAREQLELLKLSPGIRGVNPRTYQGRDAPIEFLIPGDGSDFGDAGDNWHLETEAGVNFVDAWDITTGNPEVLVGVIDSGFYRQHEDVANRYSASFSNTQSTHGTGVTSVILGEADNGVGITGINHQSLGVLSLWGINEYVSTAEFTSGDEDTRIRVVNNSWGPMGNNSGSVSNGIAYSRPYRAIAEQYSDVLHVWAAGNDGTYASTQNGALHLNDNGAEQRLDNVMVVAAFGIDGNLLPYSDFGNTVDIAAPTEFKSASSTNSQGESEYYTGSDSAYGYCYSGGFNGTSAAAPVITGAASLIFSLNPDFTAAEVKQILIDSATDFITHRHIDSQNCASANAEVAELEQPIPVVNPTAALELAQSMLSTEVQVAASVNSPFEAAADVVLTVMDDDLTFVSADWTLETQDAEGAWQSVNSGTTSELAFNVDINDGGKFRIAVDAVFTNADDTEVTASQADLFMAAPITVRTRDTITLEELAGTSVTVESNTSGPIEGEVLTNDEGEATLYLKPGSYKLFAAFEGYVDGVASTAINAADAQQLSVNLLSDEFDGVGSISGVVTDADDQPLENATVRISGGEQTNGFFASASTDAEGYYVITNISKLDSNGEPIDTFFMESSANGYRRDELSDVIVLAGKERTENFSLEAIPAPEPGDVYFSDDAESDAAEWTVTGMWNRYDFANNDPVNTLVDGGFVTLAPDEEGPQAALPEAFGDFAWWYGEEETGTFIGEQSAGDSELSGGRSVSANSGSLTSPVIDLTMSTTPALKFETWWEIESVNPNENGYDLMEIMISVDGGDTFEVVRKLNPYVDPNDSDRAPKPFSSAGFNRKPVWVSELMDLSQYAGESIVLRFNFRTNDSLYNGFRGWIMDDIMVYESEEQVPEEPIGTNSMVGSKSVKPGTADKVSEFHRIHRLPKPQPKVEVKEREQQ